MCLPGEDVHNNPHLLLPSSSAATGPNPRAGRPLQGPGVHRRDPPMDGTWPIERGGTATSSKCRQVFEGNAWGLRALPAVSDTFLSKADVDSSRRRHLPPRAISICVFRLLMLSLSSVRSLTRSLLLLLTLPPPPPPPLARTLLCSLAHPQHSACRLSPNATKKKGGSRGLWRAYARRR